MALIWKYKESTLYGVSRRPRRVLPAVVADPHALPLRPHRNAGAQFIDHTNNFVSRNPRILIPGQRPSFTNTSLWQTPQACTLISTSPAPGLGISRSTPSNSPPGLAICATLIVAGATLVVAIIPPKIFRVIAALEASSQSEHSEVPLSPGSRMPP